MSDKPLKRYGPASKYVDTGIGGYDDPVMEEVSGGLYIDEDELRGRLNEMLEVGAFRAGALEVLRLLDKPNW